jgi:hypothetical protein
MSVLENKFDSDMKNIFFTAKREIHYVAARFIQLVSEEGGVLAAKRLISKDGGTDGFTVLWENHRLDLSVEALVLKPEYSDLFTDQEKEICRKRLSDAGYFD